MSSHRKHRSQFEVFFVDRKRPAKEARTVFSGGIRSSNREGGESEMNQGEALEKSIIKWVRNS